MSRFDGERISGRNHLLYRDTDICFRGWKVLPAYLFPLDCAGRFTCRMGCVQGSQAALFRLNGWGADDISCSLVLAIHHNQALNRRGIDPKPGTRSSMQTAREDPPDMRRKRNSAASSETLLVLFCPTSTLRI